MKDTMILPKKAENFTPLSMEEYDIGYLYDSMGITTMEEEEEIDAEDAAFMQGYLTA